MPANTTPIFSLTPNISSVKCTTTSAVPISDGSSSGTSTQLMYCCWASGSNGSFLQRVRISSVANSAATSSVATTFRIFLSTVSTTVGSAAGATTAANTILLAEVSLPIIVSDHNANATVYYEVTLNMAIPTGRWILVAQHNAQTTNQNLQATAIGGDY